MKHVILLAALAVACFFLVTEAAIPGAVGGRLERAIAEGAQGAESVRVYVRTFPALALATGRVDLLRIDVRNFLAGGLRVQRLFVDVRGARMDLAGALRGRGLGLEAARESELTVIVSEGDLNAFLHSRDDLLRNLSVRLRPGAASVEGRVSVLGLPLNVTLDGRFVIEGSARLRYVVDEFRVGKTVVPKVIKDELAKRVDLSLEASGLPFPVKLQDVNVQDGVVYVFGTVGDAAGSGDG